MPIGKHCWKRWKEIIATDKFMGPNGKANYKKLWDETAKKLNALGFGSKSTQKWQKTWADYKYNLKKADAIKKYISKTEGGSSEEKDLTDFIGLEEPECGLPTDPQCEMSEDPQFNIYEDPQPGTSRDEPVVPIAEKQKINTPPPPPRKKRVAYLQEYRETINELRDIKETVKNSLDGISQNLNELTTEIRQLNNDLGQILQAQQVFYQEI